MRRLTLVGFCLLVWLSWIPAGMAQSFTASVRGTVRDASGGVLPGAGVVLVDVDRNQKFEAVTDAEGRYFITAVPPGNYQLTVELVGFKRFQSVRFNLAVQQQATVNGVLEVGEIDTALEVQGMAPLLNTTDAGLGLTVENKYIVSLPNIARDPMALVYLAPGVVGAGGARGAAGTNFVANGARNSTSEVLLDGVTVTTVEQNSGITALSYRPSVDAVEEFRAQTNHLSAEYGSTGTAVVNMITKSGTNNFHGTVFYFARHSDLNANNWFSNRANRDRPQYRRDQVGGVLGGPIVRDRTFFFGTYEYTRESRPTSRVGTVPTLRERAGDFSETLTADGRLITIFNPFDTFINSKGAVERRPFAGNIIPASLMDPVALKAMAFYPEPNQPATAAGTNNWFGQGTLTGPSYRTDMKVDHAINNKSRVSGRFSRTAGNSNATNLFAEGNPAYPFGDGPRTNTGNHLVADFTRTETATTIWTARYGRLWTSNYRGPMENFDLTRLGLPQYMKDNATYLLFPRFAPETYTAVGVAGSQLIDRQEGNHHFTGSVTKVLSAHILKFGAEMRHNFLDYQQPGFPSGNFSFRRQETRKDLTAGSAFEGNAIASMLLGWPSGMNFHIDPKVFSRSQYYGFYLQDDWRIASKLTLNLGLRYDFDRPRWEKLNRQSYWDLEALAPITVPGYELRGVMKFVDDMRRSPFNADLNNWQPRIGLAYAVTSKMSINAGYGLFHTLSRATVFGRTGAGFNIDSPTYFSLDSNATLANRLSNPYPNGMLLPPGRSEGEFTLLGLSASTIVPENNRSPEYHSWNLTINRQLPGDSVAIVSYVGSRGTHLFVPENKLTRLDRSYWKMGRTELNRQVDNPFYGIITDPRSPLSQPTVQRYRLLRPLPHFSDAFMSTSEPPAGDSYYHALQLSMNKRFSRGIGFNTSYTWSKMIDTVSHGSGNTSWLGGGTSLQNVWDFRQERALSAHDIAHRFVVNWVYQLPFGKGRRLGAAWNRPLDWIAGGWEIAGMGIFQSGVPLNVTQSGGSLWEGTQRPDLVGDPSTNGSVVDRLNNYFNGAAFVRPPVDVYGTAPRTLGYRGPGIRTVDASLNKSFRTAEGQRLEFRLEAQNATNTPIFSNPATAFGAANFGQITSTRIGPREVQIGLKYYF
jgi:hypothetical protein